MSVYSFDLPGAVPSAFLDLPHEVYRGDPHWIAEDPQAVACALSPAHDWFLAGRAKGFVIPGRARLVAFRPPSLTIDNAPAAFFGYWEHAGDSHATVNVLHEAEAWARDAGAEVLYGPVDFNTSRRYRLRLSAEAGARAFLGEPYNPPSYPAVLDAAGYRVARRYVTQVGKHRPRRVEQKEQVRDMVEATGYRIESLDSARWRANIAELKALADVIFAQNFAFSRESLETFERGYGASVARQLCPRVSLLARAAEGDIVGFVLVYPDYAPLVSHATGASRVSVNELAFGTHWPHLDQMGERTAIVRTIGVHPSHRARGVMDALMAEAVARGTQHYDRWIGALIEESNWSRRFGASQTDCERTYALFAKRLSHD